MARPRMAHRERRDGEPVYVRLSPSERAEIERAASTYDISPAEFMRRRALGYRLPANVAEQRATASLGAAFNRLGVNMNQIARQLNVGHDPSEVETELLALIARINVEMDRIYGPGGNGRGPQL